MNQNFDTFVVYYHYWHEDEFSIYEMKKKLLDEIGEDGLAEAIAIFRQKRLEREATGNYNTLYQEMKNAETNALS